MSLRLALLGAGGIAGMVADALIAGKIPGFECIAVAGSAAGSESAGKLADQLDAALVAPEEIKDLNVDWVLEAAGGDAVRQHIPGIWAAGLNTVIMSMGAFADADLWAKRKSSGARVVLPSGGIAGLDGVRSLAASGDLKSASITTTKHPRGLRGAPYLVQNNIELKEDEAVEVFSGSAREAVAGFPANVNVAIALSLAGLGPDETRVTVRSDPAATRNHHAIQAIGELACIEVQITSSPNPVNPRTSFMAGAAAIAALQEIAG